MTAPPPPGGGRRGGLWWLLPVAFIAVPLAEIWVLLQVGDLIGAWWTILLLVLDSVVGAWLLRREGSRAWRALREALGAGRVPGREIADGALVLVGGTLLLTPGFVTDAAGLLLVLPLTRPLARRALASRVARRLVVTSHGPPPGRDPRGGGPGTWPGAGPRGSGQDGSPSDGGPVIRGDVADDEDDR